jgi:hypothetical protein
MTRVTAALLAALGACPASAQTLTHRGFIETRGLIYVEESSREPERAIADLLGRYEPEWRPIDGLRLAASFDVRTDTGRQVERDWRVDWSDRGVLRPALSVRRLDLAWTRGGLTLDAGKQFVRWGRTDLLNPTDRFAPRDFIEVIDSEFLGITAARAQYERGPHMLDLVWVPRMTPSRIPLIDSRWVVVPEPAQPVSILDGGAIFPSKTQAGARYSFVGAGFEYAACFYEGLNHLPSLEVRLSGLPPMIPSTVEITRRFPALRLIGGDAEVPLRWFSIKGEAAYFRSPDLDTDDYFQFVVQVERQIGEWSLVGGYAGEAVTADRPAPSFAPDRGLTRTFLGRAAYTLDPNRSVAVEGAVRDTLDGSYVRGEFSRAAGQHLRTTVRLAWIRGEPDDFLGQYADNSYASVTVRYSF